MGKRSSIFNSRKLPVGFLVFMLLFSLLFILQSVIVTTEAFWRFCYLYGPPAGDIYLEANLRTMPQNADQKKIFIIGSSQTREAIDVELLNGEFEKDNAVVYNLGMSAAQAVDIFMIKDKLLAKKPDIMVYLPQMGSFYMDYDFRKMPHYFSTAVLPYMLKDIGIKRMLAQRSYFVESFLGESFTLYKYRTALQGILENAIKDYISGERRTEPERYLYSENRPKSYFIKTIEESDRNIYKIGPYTELSEELFTLFARDVTSAGVPLIVISSPTNPLTKLMYGKEMDSTFDSFLSKQANDIGFTYLSESQLPSFTEEDFIDFLHLNAMGRSKFSRFLMTYLENSRLH